MFEEHPSFVYTSGGTWTSHFERAASDTSNYPKINSIAPRIVKLYGDEDAYSLVSKIIIKATLAPDVRASRNLASLVDTLCTAFTDLPTTDGSVKKEGFLTCLQETILSAINLYWGTARPKVHENIYSVNQGLKLCNFVTDLFERGLLGHEHIIECMLTVVTWADTLEHLRGFRDIISRLEPHTWTRAESDDLKKALAGLLDKARTRTLIKGNRSLLEQGKTHFLRAQEISNVVTFLKIYLRCGITGG